MTLPAENRFGSRVNRAAADASDATADLLQAVEQTVDALQSRERYAKAVSEMLASLVELVEELPVNCGELDPDDEATESLAKAQATMREGYRVLSKKREHAIADSRLNGDKEEAVIASFDLAIQAHEDLHDLVEQLRVAMLEHDADVNKAQGAVSERFESMNDLIEHLKA